MKSMRKVLLFVFSSFLLTACRDKAPRALYEASYPTMEVGLSDQLLTSEYTASIKGCQTVEIRPQVSGMITKILINEGDFVRKDSILFVIDQTPYQAAYEIAVANEKSAEAALSTAELVVKSNEELFKEDVVSEFDLKTAQNELIEAEAKLALAHAQKVNAENNLSYTEVRSPVNGVASMIPYRVGALVSSNIGSPLVTVSDDSRVFAYFSLSENEVLDMIHQYGSLDKAIMETPEVELILSNGRTYDHKGHIDAISGTIDTNTGASSLRAVFPNPNRLLRDGSSGTVVIPSHRQNCIVIPQAATFELQNKIFVYKVIDGVTVSAPIKVLPQNNGREYIVETGLKVGDIIVAEGAGLVREGARVELPEVDESSEETSEHPKM